MRTRIFAEENRKWLTLAAVSVGLFMIMLDNTVVNVALPSIQHDLDADLSELQWIVTGYALTFAALMLIGGKLADAYGRRKIFVLGIVVFTLASLLCGLAGSSEMLIGARVLQGAGAALMNPATLSIIAATFPPRERGTAIGIWAGVSALALAIGPLVGGLITEHLDWSWIFFVNVPDRDPRNRCELPLHRRVPRRDARASRPARARDLRGRALRVDLRPHRGEHVRLELDPDRGLVRRSRVVSLSRSSCSSGASVIRCCRSSCSEADLHGREPRPAARRTRDVRGVLLRLAVHAEHPRLLAGAGRRGLPAR